jgi:hypothetical protein
LSQEQLDEFVERRWTLLEGAFPVSVAWVVRSALGERIGVDLQPLARARP